VSEAKPAGTTLLDVNEQSSGGVKGYKGGKRNDRFQAESVVTRNSFRQLRAG
jgi:hypothetical protein